MRIVLRIGATIIASTYNGGIAVHVDREIHV